MPNLPKPRLRRARARSGLVSPAPPERRGPNVEQIDSEGLRWVNIEQPGAPERAWLEENFDFHALDFEDVLSRNQRPKIDVYDDYLFIVLHFPIFDSAAGRLEAGELDLFVGPGYLVTIPNQPLQPVEYLFERCRANEQVREELFSKGSGYLLYKVVDSSFDYCFPMLRKIGNKLEQLEDWELHGAEWRALELAERNAHYYMPFQYANDANPRAHYEGTGSEIAEMLDRVDILVAGLGTGGTLMGAGKRLRESFPDMVVAAAEPMPGDPVIGLRSLEEGYVPPILDVSQLDRKILVSNTDAIAGLQALLESEGIFAGVSSGAVVQVALGLATELEQGVVVCVLADAGWKYLSANLWRLRETEVELAMEGHVWW